MKASEKIQVDSFQQYDTSSVESRVERFLQAAHLIAKLAHDKGFRVRVAEDTNLPIFRSLAPHTQVEVVDKIEKSCDIYRMAAMSPYLQASAESFDKTTTLVWAACSRFGLRPPSDFFDKLTDEDVIQVYSQEGIHQFSNLKFFEVCSYTLEQIHCMPWHLLWIRDQGELDFLTNAVISMLGQDQKKTIEFNRPLHVVKEVISPLKYETTYSLRYGAPLFCRETGEKRGLIVSESVKLTHIYTAEEEERLLREFDGHKNNLWSV